ncbi:MAG TPA: hypothetical protein VHZ07_00020 [Bryobacteraceae bacterium]|jgi:hypothetical protein|nr:hypothetical protein [Bryobacteraceae bacterium]
MQVASITGSASDALMRDAELELLIPQTDVSLRSMFLYGFDFFLLRPGLIVLVIGLLLTLPEMYDPFKLGPVTLSLYWMMFGMTIAVVGLQSFYLGCIAQVFYDYPPRQTCSTIWRFWVCYSLSKGIW